MSEGLVCFFLDYAKQYGLGERLNTAFTKFELVCSRYLPKHATFIKSIFPYYYYYFENDIDAINFVVNVTRSLRKRKIYLGESELVPFVGLYMGRVDKKYEKTKCNVNLTKNQGFDVKGYALTYATRFATESKSDFCFGIDEHVSPSTISYAMSVIKYPRQTHLGFLEIPETIFFLLNRETVSTFVNTDLYGTEGKIKNRVSFS